MAHVNEVHAGCTEINNAPDACHVKEQVFPMKPSIPLGLFIRAASGEQDFIGGLFG